MVKAILLCNDLFLVNTPTCNGPDRTSVDVDAALTAAAEPAKKMQQRARTIDRESSMAAIVMGKCVAAAQDCSWRVQTEAAPWLPC